MDHHHKKLQQKEQEQQDELVLVVLLIVVDTPSRFLDQQKILQGFTPFFTSALCGRGIQIVG